MAEENKMSRVKTNKSPHKSTSPLWNRQLGRGDKEATDTSSDTRVAAAYIMSFSFGRREKRLCKMGRVCCWNTVRSNAMQSTRKTLIFKVGENLLNESPYLFQKETIKLLFLAHIGYVYLLEYI